METAALSSSTPVWGPQVSGSDFSRRLNFDTSRTTFKGNLAPGVIAKVRETLRRDWFIMGRDGHREQLMRNWLPPWSLRLGSQMIQLYESQQENGKILPVVAQRYEHRFYNKATVFYWMDSAIVNRGDADGLVILGSIWNTWADALGRQPQFQLDDFFAVPVSVSEEMAKTIPEILRAHHYIWFQLRKTLEEKRARADKDPRFFRLHPLCGALIAVFDEYKFVPSGYIKQADGSRHYENVAQHQSILLVRTGNEDGLSAPISFASLEHKALPLARCEDMGLIDIIRIPLQDGVRFVANLLLREEAAFPESVLGESHISKELDHPFVKHEREAFEWGERRLAQIQELGKFSSSSTVTEVKEAVRVRERLDENPELYAPIPFKFGWV